MTLDAGELKCLADIERYGCHIIHVLESEDYPRFSYSVGIQRSSHAPELVVLGLRQELCQSIINEYNARVRSGELFESGDIADGFLEGFPCQFRAVGPSHYRQHFGWNLWLNDGKHFDVLQLIYPDTRGIWPWQVPEDDPFRLIQPLLAS